MIYFAILSIMVIHVNLVNYLMPELPEVQTVASELNRKLKNRKIQSVIVKAPKIIGVGPAVLSPKRKTPPSAVSKFEQLIIGQKFLSVSRRAKLLIFDLSGLFTLLAHLKMTGQFIFEDKALRRRTGGKYRIINKLKAPLVAMPCKHTHVIFEFTDSSRLYFNDVRKFGYLKLVHDSEISQVKELEEFGPEPFSKNFQYPHFMTAVKKRGYSRIKEVLMDQRVVAGIGNIYSDEILFHAKIRPLRRVASLSGKELRSVYKSIRPVLFKGIQAKGSSVGEYVRTDGSWGRMGKYHFVYGRGGQECKVCGTIITSVKLNGRTGSFCPRCQE